MYENVTRNTFNLQQRGCDRPRITDVKISCRYPSLHADSLRGLWTTVKSEPRAETWLMCFRAHKAYRGFTTSLCRRTRLRLNVTQPLRLRRFCNFFSPRHRIALMEHFPVASMLLCGLKKKGNQFTPGEEAARLWHLPRCRVVLRPHSDEFIQVMRAQNGGISGEVLKVVHDDSNKEVQHLAREQEEVQNDMFTSKRLLYQR